jgi:hypothetical protein
VVTGTTEQSVISWPSTDARVAKECGCAFLDTGQVIASSDLDGIHLEASQHAKPGAVVAARVRALFARQNALKSLKAPNAWRSIGRGFYQGKHE